jgi:hypothetical protein
MILTVNQRKTFLESSKIGSPEIAVFCLYPIGACCMLSVRIHAFIPPKWKHFQDHIVMLHTVRPATEPHATMNTDGYSWVYKVFHVCMRAFRNVPNIGFMYNSHVTILLQHITKLRPRRAQAFHPGTQINIRDTWSGRCIATRIPCEEGVGMQGGIASPLFAAQAKDD